MTFVFWRTHERMLFYILDKASDFLNTARHEDGESEVKYLIELI